MGLENIPKGRDEAIAGAFFLALILGTIGAGILLWFLENKTTWGFLESLFVSGLVWVFGSYVLYLIIMAIAEFSDRIEIKREQKRNTASQRIRLSSKR